MNSNFTNIGTSFQKLEVVAQDAIEKIGELKKVNNELRGEVNELKRLLALSEKKAERLKREVDELKNNGQQAWQTKEKDIKNRLLRLSAKISAFEKDYSSES